ncbi:MAG: LytTR family transcriptional regulator [Cereibacter sphaeroides]|uniref:LytTR family transcriptional regulator n=1 Tax=Cereibacter sphaeroides TaxID=1063 RepID=A0A2W5TLS3_CERSP|nr:MAG: LytTR family transcriptional regulator [Cereibacter sphaeroides]
MWIVGPIGFTVPWLLLGLIALPILWLLLRAVPPAPIRRRFPGVALLLGLTDDETETDKTPWWLLLLRMLAVAAAIIAFAGPILHPQPRQEGTGPLLILLDGGWADARDWPRRIERAEALVQDAGRAGRAVAVLRVTDRPQMPEFQTADAWTGRLAALQPQPWAPNDMAGWINALPEGLFDSFWLSDGLDHPARADLLAALEDRGSVTVFESPRPIVALRPPLFEEGVVKLRASRPSPTEVADLEVSARGLDPAGVERELARVPIAFAAGETEATTDLSLPPELRNRLSRFEIAGVRSAGAVSLTDDSLKRRKVAIISGPESREGLQLLSPTHYLERALDPVADLIRGTLDDVLLASPDVIILADVARLSPTETDGVMDWLDKGGLLLRFAGPRLAASDVSRAQEDPLMPVRLREGGRQVGGAMSWGEPKSLAPFAEGSPFHGLQIPSDVTVSAQVLAQPDPELASRTIAALADGTPLVTRKTVGQGQVVLIHVTANAEWSSLPLSGLFVQMLERLAVSTRPAAPDAEELAGQIWVPETALDAFGIVSEAGDVAGVPGEVLAEGIVTGPRVDLPPGLYAGNDRRVALNVINADTVLAPSTWPERVPVEGLAVTREQALKGAFLAGALALLMIDIFASLFMTGRLRGARAAAVLLVAFMVAGAPSARAQAPSDDAFALRATNGVVLAYVMTGDPQVDSLAEAGLRGLGQKLFERTSIEPDPPMGVNLETDELSFFPFLYWPVTANQPIPSAEAYAALNRYLLTGGMILFDTRDADVAGAGGTTPEGRRLQELAAQLDIPPLEQIPQDHVLTRTFYLLQDFPGRYAGRSIWVEAAPPDAEQVEGMPFRNLNDGVTPVVIGGNDWASAWATDQGGMPMYPVGRGFAGERQREISYRFGINLIMHVLTGNYKSDQVHVPALLERLGQ